MGAKPEKTHRNILQYQNQTPLPPQACTQTHNAGQNNQRTNINIEHYRALERKADGTALGWGYIIRIYPIMRVRVGCKNPYS